jgi:hypothetical protein
VSVLVCPLCGDEMGDCACLDVVTCTPPEGPVAYCAVSGCRLWRGERCAYDGPDGEPWATATATTAR